MDNPQESQPTTPTSVSSAASPLTDQSTSAGAGGASPSEPQATKPERPGWLPESFWDAEKGEAKGDEFTAHLKGLEDLKTADEARRAGIPEAADKYELAVPKDFELPEGFVLNPDNPTLGKARELAHSFGLSQDQFSQLIALDVAAKAAEAMAFNQAVEARLADDLKALGANGQQRKDAVLAGLKAVAGEEGVALSKNVLWTKQAVEVFEKLLTAGNDGLSAGGGADPEPGKIPNYDKMSFRDQWKASNRQPQRRAG